mmetsp:Transcript_4999/g.9512  ORF Transcript_4999/g.9512 Transcript_4999/m.9512 type:complete len:251 (-) Transcript_4999:155-907(-)
MLRHQLQHQRHCLIYHLLVILSYFSSSFLLVPQRYCRLTTNTATNTRSIPTAAVRVSTAGGLATILLTPTFILASSSLSSSSSSSCPDPPPTETIMTNNIPRWYQKTISITAPSRGCHLITSEVNKAIRDEISTIRIGMANLFIQHTSASLTVNENADPDVRRDMEVGLNKIVPASWNHDGTFKHTMEGDDDMPGHMKSSLMGISLNIPISNGRLALGTWQGIYLNEHRDQGGWGGGHTRNIVITLQGQS